MMFLKWMFAFGNPKELLQNHTSFLAEEILIYVCFLLALKHAVRHSGRCLSLFLAILGHGLFVESCGILFPDGAVVYHSQSTIMLMGRKLPLHVLCLYPTMLYTATVAVSRLRISGFSQMFAVGLVRALMIFPRQVLGVKLLWYTLHDTDPNLEERFYSFPWMLLCFPVVAASSLSLALYASRRMIIGRDKEQCLSFKELMCSILAMVLTLPALILQLTIIYYIPHYIFQIPSTVCVCDYLIICVLFTWAGDRYKGATKRQSKSNIPRKPDELLLLVVIYFLFYVATVIVAKPENIVSDGFHEPIGNCNDSLSFPTTIGVIFNRKKYLCASNYDESYFDFHCAVQPTTEWENREKYVICGTPFENHNEYIAIMTSAAFFGIYIFYQLHMNSFSTTSESQENKKIK